ncbi:MAG: CDP-archaeol synthase [Patescibacteria group bacterium]|nr:CDP-archaeol synthase [Patescibacteria group bacterium]MDD5294822.1 CDP-archaeol synthase [Patescibacteria group bacterium]MDD5554789.1 CDP-archaeol synthase [Patescibacteria group bacterium]
MAVELKFLSGVFWLFLPAAFANMAPVFFKRLPFLAVPMDFGRSLAGKRIFGDNKTWRGLFSGVLISLAVIEIQIWLYPFSSRIAIIDYGDKNIIWLGLALGVGAILGDAIESFIKRRLNISPGKNFPIADQIDWILGAMLLSSLFYSWSPKIWLEAILMFGLLHPLANIVGYFLRLKPNKL